jgi:hypothetical protein
MITIDASCSITIKILVCLFLFFSFPMGQKRKVDIHKMIEKEKFYIYTKKMIATYDEIKI